MGQRAKGKKRGKLLKKKVIGLSLGALLFALSVSAQAQQAAKIPRIGFVSGRSTSTPANSDQSAAAFRQGMRELGYVEGKNISVEYRYAEGKLDRFTSIVAELVQRNVDVLVSPSLPAMRAAKQATRTIPIVMMVTSDPVAAGLVDSLARPGGNITGLYRLTRDLSGKRLELLREQFQGQHVSELSGIRKWKARRLVLKSMRQRRAH
jgi:ABC-type uncharacterized transport system substrate-binding protein